MPEEFVDRAEFIGYFRDEAEELLARIEADSLRLEGLAATGGTDLEVVNSLFRALHTLKGNSAMLGFADMASVAHGLESLCDRLRSIDEPPRPDSVELLFGGRDLLAKLLASPGSAPPELATMLERLEEYAKPQDEASAFEADVARMLAVQQAAKAPAHALPLQTGRRPTIRVDIARLDALLNLVGELVVTRTRISEIATELSRLNRDADLAKGLSDSASLLARIAGDIQESVMNIRMVPIGQVFDRFPRLVRDVAKARGKEVHLEISGAQTELDKTIVDEISEPLMHLLRNCLDHGIETAAQRQSVGKAPEGAVKLAASHEGNQILIEIADDGAGIDLDRVRARACELGVVRPHDALESHEVVELIFTPGFSTANEISEVSGRGIGMDVVKKSITRLKGRLEVYTEPGKGTRFMIKLPLTVAIIDALLVRVAKELYALPIDSIVESRRVELDEIQILEDTETIILRDEIVPLVRVAEFFELNSARDPEKAMVVIVSVQGRQVGLVVDAFEAELEIVIKPLSDVVGRIPGISGATILGSGSIALILDVHALAAEALTRGRGARAEFSAAQAT